MAYKAVLDHPKFASLKAQLELPKAFTLGILEALWHFTSRYTPAGNVGKYTDTEIESWLEWDGARGACIAALVMCGWLDTSDEHRLVVHDWQDWADEYTHTMLARKPERFANGDLPRTGRLNQTERKKFNDAVADNKVLGPKSEKLHSQPDSLRSQSDSLTETSASGPLPYQRPYRTRDLTVPETLPESGPLALNRSLVGKHPDSALSAHADDRPFFSQVVLTESEKTAKWPASKYQQFWNDHVPAAARVETIPDYWLKAINAFRKRGLKPATFLAALKKMEEKTPIESSRDFYHAMNAAVRDE
jgi:hypothetical protein